jgi:anti-anti-sigma factor
VQVIPEADRIVVAITGEIDLTNAPALIAQIDDAIAGRTGKVVVDLTAVDFMDSQGVHLLVTLTQRPGIELVVVAPRGSIACELITITDLGTYVTLWETPAGPDDG